MALSARPVQTSKIAMDLLGTSAGPLVSYDAGSISAPVISEAIGGTNQVQKHIAGPVYGQHKLKCNPGMGKNFYGWIKDSISQSHKMCPQGAVHALDTDMNNISSVNFFNALVTNVAFPAVDATSKEAALLEVDFQPEYYRNVKGTGKMAGGAITPSKANLWKAHNFKMTLDGHPDASSFVTKVESLTMGQTTSMCQVGSARDPMIVPGATSFSNLKVTLTESHADTLYTYHESFLIKGLCSTDKEISASLEYLAADLKTVLFTVSLTGLGIINLTPEPLTTGSAAHRQITAEFYFTSMDFTVAEGVYA